MAAANPAVSTRSTLSHRPFGGRCSLARERRAFRRVRRRRHPRRADAGHGAASQASANALSCVRVCVYVRARFCICVRAYVMVCVAAWLQVPALRGKPALPGAQPRAARVLQPGRRRASTGWPPRQMPSARCKAATVHMPAAARQAPRSTEAGRSLCSSGLAWCVCVRQICKINMQEYAQNMQNMQVSVSVRILHIYSPPTPRRPLPPTAPSFLHAAPSLRVPPFLHAAPFILTTLPSPFTPSSSEPKCHQPAVVAAASGAATTPCVGSHRWQASRLRTQMSLFAT